MHTRLSLIALSSAALALVASPALSQDADAFGQRFVSLMTASGVEISYETARTEGDTVILSNFSVAPVGEDPIVIPGDLIFSGVAALEDGSFTAEAATIEDIDFTPETDDDDPTVNITAANFLIENITLPAQYRPGDLSALLLYTHFSVGPITITVNDEPIFSIDNIIAESDFNADLTEITSWYELGRMEFALERLLTLAGEDGDFDDVEEALEILSALEIETLVSSYSGSGTWWPETGEAVLDEMRFDFENLGSFVMAGEFVGYTAEVYAEMMKTQQKVMDAGSDLSRAESDALEAAMLALFEDFGLASVMLRYEDASLFNKVLAIAAAEQGVSPETLVQGLQFGAGMALAQIGNPALTQAVTTAVNTFVSNPQSLTISLNPATPVTFGELMAFGDDPLALIDLLGATITAND